MIQKTRERHPTLMRCFSTGEEKEHGRIERRDISVLSTENTVLSFEGVQQIAEVIRYREIIGKEDAASTEVVYLITNIPAEQAGAEELLSLNRGYWGIENSLHYRKDEVFGEDRSTIRRGNGPQNMSALRNLAISVLHMAGIQNVKRCVDNLKHNPVLLMQKLFGVKPQFAG